MRAFLTVAVLVATTGCTEQPTVPGHEDWYDEEPVEEEPVLPPSVAVEPARPLAGETLRCAVDQADAKVAWQVDGEPADVVGAEVPGERVDGYQQWTCEAVRPGGVGAEASVEVEEACTALATTEALIADYDPHLDLARKAGTVEAWLYLDLPQTVPAGLGVRFTALAHQDEKVLGGEGTDFLVRFDGTEVLEVVTGPADDGCGTLRVDAPSLRAWHHVAVSWNPDTRRKRVFVDGAQVATCLTDRAELAYGPVVVGAALVDDEVIDRFPGFVDEVRLSETMRYTGDFTPDRYPKADADTVWLLHFDDAAALGRPVDSPVARDSSGSRVHVPLAEGVTLSAERSTCEL